MGTWRRWERVSSGWRVVLILALVIALGAGSASAKKPPKPPPPDPDPVPTLSGTLVCTDAGDLFTMAPSGADDETLELPTPCTGASTGTKVSRARHNGKLWRINKCVVGGEGAVDGADHEEIFLIAEDATTSLQLTDDLSMVLSYYNEALQWGPDDEFISWVAHTMGVDAVTGDDTIVEAGIFTAPLLYDTEGDIVGLADDPVLVVSVDTLTLLNESVVTMVRNGHDWSPDGTQVVWHHFDNELYVTDVDYPTVHTLLTETATTWTGVWSSEDEIAFSTGLLIKCINANGSGETTVITAKAVSHGANPGRTSGKIIIKIRSNP